MGLSNSKVELNVDYEIENLNNSLKSLIFEVKSLLESKGKEEKFRLIKTLIKKDIDEIENFLNSNFDLSLALLCRTGKIEDLLDTLIAEKSDFEPTRFNIIKNQNKKIFPYEEKLMNFISQYSDDSSCFNNIYQGNPRNLSGGKKLIFSGNLNNLNIISDEIIIAIPPIYSVIKLETMKSQISKFSEDFSIEEKSFFQSEDFDSFLSDNTVDFLMKFAFMLQNNNVIIYLLSAYFDKEVNFLSCFLKMILLNLF